MYAVIKTGGKQYRVSEGQRLDVERFGAESGADVTLTPVLVVDGDTVLATPDALAKASVSARVVGETRGKKIIGFTYKPKSRARRRWGHRQNYATIEITGISAGASKGSKAPKSEKAETQADTETQADAQTAASEED